MGSSLSTPAFTWQEALVSSKIAFCFRFAPKHQKRNGAREGDTKGKHRNNDRGNADAPRPSRARREHPEGEEGGPSQGKTQADDAVGPLFFEQLGAQFWII